MFNQAASSISNLTHPEHLAYPLFQLQLQHAFHFKTRTSKFSSQDLATKHGKGTLLDDYDYVMHGKVFKFKDNHNTGQLKVEVYVSYGGLLMQITGSPKELESLEVDSNVFLLMRKV